MAGKKSMRKVLIVFLVLLALLAVAVANLYWQGLIPHRAYTEKDFHIERVVSSYDFNRNEVDDYTDILLGAREDAGNFPYDNSTTSDKGDYSSDNEDICSGLIWRAFLKAGYNLKGMVNEDIKVNTDKYPAIEGIRNREMDFRQVKNLKVFFDRYALNLTTDPYEIAEWQPGDIVIFGTDHIGIISDKRNAQGIPFLIHNGGQPEREEDALLQQHFFHPISGHYRFQGDAAYKEIFRVVKKD